MWLRLLAIGAATLGAAIATFWETRKDGKLTPAAVVAIQWILIGLILTVWSELRIHERDEWIEKEREADGLFAQALNSPIHTLQLRFIQDSMRVASMPSLGIYTRLDGGNPDHAGGLARGGILNLYVRTAQDSGWIRPEGSETAFSVAQDDSSVTLRVTDPALWGPKRQFIRSLRRVQDLADLQIQSHVYWGDITISADFNPKICPITRLDIRVETGQRIIDVLSWKPVATYLNPGNVFFVPSDWADDRQFWDGYFLDPWKFSGVPLDLSLMRKRLRRNL